MIVVVTGGRDYQGDVAQALESFHKANTISLLIHGGARGADTRAGEWAKAAGIHTAVVAALWGTHGKAAGHIRNAVMIKMGPQYCIQFPGGKGTANMVEMCMDAKIPYWSPYGGLA